MQKTILSLAIAASIVTPGLVFAGDAYVYGHGQVEIGSYGADGDGTTVADNARGRIGFAANDDLGNGLEGILKFEFKIDTADGDSDKKGGNISLQKRENMVGLKGSFGQVELGRLKSAYKYTGGVKYDPYVATLLEARGNAGMTGKVGAGNAFGHNAFINDSIAYQNKFGIATIRITYDLDDGGSASSTNAQGANALSASLKLGGKKWEAFIALVDDDEDSASAKGNYSSTKLGGQFKMGKAGKFNAQYEMSETDVSGATTDIDTLYLDYQFKLSKKNTIDVAYGIETTSTTGSADVERDFMRLALGHKFSKKTKVWAGLRNTNSDVNGEDEQVIVVGLQRRFDTK